MGRVRVDLFFDEFENLLSIPIFYPLNMTMQCKAYKFTNYVKLETTIVDGPTVHRPPNFSFYYVYQRWVVATLKFNNYVILKAIYL
jgi:hypothetical protein